MRFGPVELLLFAVAGDLLRDDPAPTIDLTTALVNRLFCVESNRSWFIIMPILLFGAGILIA